MKHKFILAMIVSIFLIALASADLQTPTHYWKFNEVGLGARIANDTMGLRNLSNNVTGVTYSAGKLNNAIKLNASINGIASNTTGSPTFAFDTGNFSIGFWFNGSSTPGYQAVETKQDSGGWSIELNTNGTIAFVTANADQGGTKFSVMNGTFQRVWMVREGTGAGKFRYYVNGTNTANFTLNVNFTNSTAPLLFRHNGAIINWDDFRIYKGYALTLSDITTDWANGGGQELAENAGTINNSIISPVNGTTTIDNPVVFNISSSADQLELTVTTLRIYYANGTLFNLSAGFTSGGNITNFTIISVPNFTIGTYFVSAQSCGVNATSTICSVTPNNTLFWGLQVNAEYFSPATTSLSTETFQINITIPSGVTSYNAVLTYNNTNYTATSTQVGNNVAFTRQISIPFVTGTTTKSFFWTIELTQGGVSNSFQRSANNQQINVFSLDNCTANTALILNYTLRDEDDQSFLVPNVATLNTTINVLVTISNILDGTQQSLFNATYNNTNPARVCIPINAINQSQSYRLDAIAEYFTTNRVVEYYNTQNFTLTNTSIPQNINLFDLLITRSQSFLITVKDENFLPVEDAIIEIQRKYIGEGVYKIVEIPKTDGSGQAIGHFVLEDAIYTLVAKKDGVIIKTLNDVQTFCEDVVVGNCRIEMIQDSPDIFFTSNNEAQNITFTETFSNGLLTFIYSTTDGSSPTVQFNVTVLDNYGNNTICSPFVSGSSGTLLCNVALQGNITVVSQAYKNGQLISQNIYIQAPDSDVIYPGARILLFLAFAMTLPFMGIASGIAFAVLIVVDLILVITLNIYNGGSILGVTSIVIFGLFLIGIILWKSNKNGRD